MRRQILDFEFMNWILHIKLHRVLSARSVLKSTNASKFVKKRLVKDYHQFITRATMIVCGHFLSDFFLFHTHSIVFNKYYKFIQNDSTKAIHAIEDTSFAFIVVSRISTFAYTQYAFSQRKWLTISFIFIESHIDVTREHISEVWLTLSNSKHEQWAHIVFVRSLAILNK